MRVHELAKELNVDSKAIIGFLKTRGIEGIAAVSNISDDLIKEVREHFSQASQKKNEAPKAVALPDYIVKKMEAEAKEAQKKEAPVQSNTEKAVNARKEVPEQKKKKISAVFNPQHARSDKTSQDAQVPEITRRMMRKSW